MYSSFSDEFSLFAHAGPGNCLEISAAIVEAGGQFPIDQGKMVDSNVEGVIVTGSGHWLMEEAPDKVMPTLVAFLNK